MRRKIPRQRKGGVRSHIGPGVRPLCLGSQQTVKRIFLSQQQKERPPITHHLLYQQRLDYYQAYLQPLRQSCRQPPSQK